MPQLVMSLLGPIQFTLDGRPLTEFESDKARALLIYLTMHAGQPHRREHLSGLFWPEQDERGALQNLRKTLSRLRQTLRPGHPELVEGSKGDVSSFLLVTPQTVQFNADSDYTLDVNAFQSLLAETQHHRHRRLGVCRICMERLAHAVRLYRGDFLAGFAIKGSPEFDDWAALQRERLRLQILDVLQLLATYHDRRDENATALDYARRQLELEPWQEATHRQVMRILARQGKRAAAIAQYKTCHQILARELDVEPEPETTALYERIRAEGQGRGGAGGGAAPPHLRTREAAPLLNFPARLTSFVGREKELAHIGELLQDPDCRLLTLVGPGGSGKTRLALEAATAEASTFEDGVCFVALASLGSADSIASTVAGALGMPLLATQDVKAQVLAYLRDKEMLLVFDNFEHLLSILSPEPVEGSKGEGPAASLVSAKLQACPGLSILVTSREPLHLYGEREFPVPPLSTPGLSRAQGATGATRVHAHVASLSQFSAVELFVQRSQAVNPGFRFSDENAAAVGEICDRLDGLPLAIELAAARSKLFNAHEMVAQLQHRLAFLTVGARDLPPRQQTLWSTIDWSYNLLAPREQILFRRLAAFAGGFTSTAVDSICNADGALGRETFNHLTALADKSLILLKDLTGPTRLPTNDPRFDMLETLRDYVLNKLQEAKEVEHIRDEHLRFYCAFAEDAESKMLHGEMQQSIARLEYEHDNLRAALAWAYERGHIEPGLRLVGALSRFWRSCGYLDEGGDWAARMLAAGAEDSSAVRARALLGAAEIARIAGHDDQARSLAESSLAMYRGLSDQAGAGYALAVLGAMAHYARAREQATNLLAEAEALFRAAGDERGLAYTLLWLGDVRLRMGDLDWAARCFGEALPIFRALDDRIYLSWALGGLGDIARLRGNYAEAEAALKEALKLHVAVNNKAGMPFPIEALAIVAVAQGQDERAAMLWGIVEALRQALDMPVPDSYQADYDPYSAETRARLGETAFDEIKDEGRALPFEQAVEFVLKGL